LKIDQSISTGQQDKVSLLWKRVNQADIQTIIGGGRGRQGKKKEKRTLMLGEMHPTSFRLSQARYIKLQ